MHAETEVAWAAGFFDGEGHIRVAVVRGSRGREEGYLHLQMNVAQVRREPLERFMDVVGVGSISLEPRTPPANDIHRWKCGGNGPAAQAIGRIWPYLSAPKREQAEAALAAIDQDLRENPRDHYRQLRQRIIDLSNQGLSPLEIAPQVGLARRTVYYHLRKATKDQNNG